MARLPRVSGKRGTKVGRDGRTAKQRLKGVNRVRARKDFGRRLLKSFGLSGGDFKKSSFVHSKLGLFDKPLSEKKKDSSSSIDLPSLMSPEKVGNETAPDISSIVKQLNSLLKTANKLGVLSKEQQDIITQQIKSAKRVAKEQSVESGVSSEAAALAGGAGGIDGGSITPLNDAVQQLADSLSKLTDIVKEKVDEQEEEEPERGFIQRLAEEYGLGDWNKERKEKLANRRPTLNEGVKAERTKSGKIRYRNASGQFIKEADAIATKKVGAVGRGINAVKSGVGKVLNPIQAVASKAAKGTVARASNNTSKIINAMRGTVTKSVAKGAAAKVASKEAIQRLAKPLLAKSIGKTALKSIPILGAVAGIGFAAKRLVEGDVVGAGLEAASGLAGPLTAVPALALSVSRDIYSNLYGMQPEEDPDFASRMGVVLGAVKALAANMLGSSVEPKDKPTSKEAGQSAQASMPKIPAIPPQAEKKAGPSGASLGGGGGGMGTGGESASSSIPSDGAKPADSSAPSGGSGSSMPTPSTKMDADKTSAKPAASVAEQTPISMPAAASPTATPEQPITKTGQSIAQASVENNSLASSSAQTVFPGTSIPRPSTTPTSKNGARGMGNVPDPTYYGAGIIPAQLYFRQVA